MDSKFKENRKNGLLIAGIVVITIIVILLTAVLLNSRNSDTEKVVFGSTEAELNVKDMVFDIIADIRGQDGFMSDGYWEPLVVCDDFNGDGIQELLAVYEVQKSDVEFDVMYDLWSLLETGAVRIKSDTLFVEVGGNSGLIGIVQSGDARYLAVVQYEPEAEAFNNYYNYWLWNVEESSLAESSIYMECHGIADEEEQGKYILGNTRVDKDAYDERQSEFSNWIYKLDIFEDPRNGNVMTFDELLSHMK